MFADNTDFFPDKLQLVRTKYPRDINSLCEFLQKVGVRSEFTVLRNFAKSEERFFPLIGFLWKEAQQSFQIPKALHIAKQLTLTQRDCLRILANAFFCLFTRRRVLGEYPTLNFNLLFDGREDILTAKLQMFTAYFLACEQRIKAGDSLQREISFVLRESEQKEIDWQSCQELLTTIEIRRLKESIDEAKNCWRVDFANKYLGGAALSHGCVQEEIMFAICPELNVGRLFCRYMRPNEAIGIVGAEQFSLPKGYGWSLRYGGTYSDSTPVQENCLQSHIVAVDAEDYRHKSRALQYEKTHILRDLNKSFAGFSMPSGPTVIATGNWGCGVFGGDPEFKLLLQWMSASKAGRTIQYFPFDQSTIAHSYPNLIRQMHAKKIRVCDLFGFVITINPQRSVFDQLVDFVDAF